MAQGGGSTTTFTVTTPTPRSSSSSKNKKFCVVCTCTHKSIGRRYGEVQCCGACATFFRRAVLRQKVSPCPGNQDCDVTKERSRCQFCRFQKCLRMGMWLECPQSDPQPEHQLSPSSPINSPMEDSDSDPLLELMFEQIWGSGSDRPPTTPNHAYDYTPTIITEEDQDEEMNASSSTLGTNMGDEEAPRPTSIWQAIQLMYTKNNPTPPPPITIPQNGANFTLFTQFTSLAYKIAYVGEIASKILLITFHWGRNLPDFQDFSQQAQEVIMKSAWSEVFVVELAHQARKQNLFLLPLARVSDVLRANANMEARGEDDVDNSTPQKLTTIKDYAATLKGFWTALEQLKLDDSEYELLKVLALFSPDRYYTDANAIEAIQAVASQQLQDYEMLNAPTTFMSRINSILLLLPQLRAINPPLVEELFAGLVLNKPILLDYL